jgi:carnitine O-acetyltransferase
MFEIAPWFVQRFSTIDLSTSNCGNPALRMFGFGPVSAQGFGIGYIIKDHEIAYCVGAILWASHFGPAN